MIETDIERENGIAIVHPNGDIVASSVPALRASLRELLTSGVKEIKIDLQQVKMVDSTGLGLLISTFNSLRKTDGVFSIVHTSDEIMRFFQAMRLPQHFSVSGTSAEQ